MNFQSRAYHLLSIPRGLFFFFLLIVSMVETEFTEISEVTSFLVKKNTYKVLVKGRLSQSVQNSGRYCAILAMISNLAIVKIFLERLKRASPFYT